MPARHRRSSFIARSQRRKLVWATTDVGIAGLPAGQVTNLDLLATIGVSGGSTLGVTVGRTHLTLMSSSVSATIPSVSFGLIVGRAADIGTNVAGQVSPASNELDWLYLERWFGTSSGATLDSTQVRYVDNRSKRKLQELQQRYIFSLINSGTTAFTGGVWCRALVMLP
jgi:hypothetical protein